MSDLGDSLNSDFRFGSGKNKLWPALPGREMGGERGIQARVCLVVREFAGVIRNAGTGTAYTSLAMALAAHGHKVVVLLANGPDSCESGDGIQYWKSHYSSHGVELHHLPDDDESSISAPWMRRLSYRVMAWLKDRDGEFDVVHFHEWLGLGYYTALVRHLGLAFGQMRVVVGTHSPYGWSFEGNYFYYSCVDDLERDYMEIAATRLSDYVVSPSHYLLNWMRERNWDLPSSAYVQPNLMPDISTLLKVIEEGEVVREVVFFGRLQERKGVVLFCDAIDQLNSLAGSEQVCVTFLGKHDFIRGVHSSSYIAERAKAWSFQVKVLADYGRDDAMGYLRGQGRIAVIPSLRENSPYAVFECLATNVPFLASNVGGIPELVREGDRERVCFSLDPESMAAALLGAVGKPPVPARASFDLQENERAWVSWHEVLATEARKKGDGYLSDRNVGAPLKVTVVVCHRDNAEFLTSALESISAQSYGNLEILVVDRGSSSPDALGELGKLETGEVVKNCRVIYGGRLRLGEAFNLGVQQGTGCYALLMEECNYITHDAIEKLVGVACTVNADVVTCASYSLQSKSIPDTQHGATLELPLGPSLACGVFDCMVGGITALVARRTFLEEGGFGVEAGIDREEWELFSRMALAGRRVELLPLPLYWRRIDGRSQDYVVSEAAGVFRAMEPYFRKMPAELAGLVFMAKGIVNSPAPPALSARRMVRLGFAKGINGLIQRHSSWRWLYGRIRSFPTVQMVVRYLKS